MPEHFFLSSNVTFANWSERSNSHNPKENQGGALRASGCTVPPKALDARFAPKLPPCIHANSEGTRRGGRLPLPCQANRRDRTVDQCCFNVETTTDRSTMVPCSGYLKQEGAPANPIPCPSRNRATAESKLDVASRRGRPHHCTTVTSKSSVASRRSRPRRRATRLVASSGQCPCRIVSGAARRCGYCPLVSSPRANGAR
jgi:hypothetical protein